MFKQKTTWFTLEFLLLVFSFEAMAQVSGLREDFATCTNSLNAPWVVYSVNGNQIWECNDNGFQDHCAYMNGYANSTNYANEDWLITPKLDLKSYFQPVLHVDSRTKYSGNSIEVLYSTTYSGSGNPNAATWNTLGISLPAVNSDYWKTSLLDVSSLKNTPFYIAFKYTSTTNASASWKLDNIRIQDSLSNRYLLIGDTKANVPSNSKSFQFIKAEINSLLTVSATYPFELSKNNTSFSSNLSFSSAEAGLLQTVYVRIHPTIANKTYKGNVQFSYEGTTQGSGIFLFGTSVDPEQSIKTASWNMRWFGYPSFCDCDTALAKQNATAVLKNIQADIYFLQEVVDVQQVRAVCHALGSNYNCLISNFCSFASDSSDNQYSSGQKLAFIYNTQKINPVQHFGLLQSTYPANNDPYYCFSSGRFPHVLKAKVNTTLVNDTVVFVNIHAKADNTFTDYQRRSCAASYMRDSLLALFPGSKTIIMGDYNDYLEGSTVNNQSVSPYAVLFNSGFNGISLPSLYPTASSFSGSQNHLIDNVSCSSSAVSYYTDSSFHVLPEFEQLFPEYAQTTSDHYPIIAYWHFPYPNAVNEISGEFSGIELVNPTKNTLTLWNKEKKTDDLRYTINSPSGEVLYKGNCFIQNKIELAFPSLQPGLYMVKLEKNNQPYFFKWLVVP